MSITIREALQLPDMVQTRLVAGASGLDNPIRWVTIVEVLEDASRLQEGEFLITTGFGLDGDKERIASFIPTLARQKLSGVAIHTGFYLRDIPPEFVAMADEYRLPLIEIPVEVNFSTITKAILQPLINKQFETLAYSQAIHNQMIEAALAKGGLRAVVSELASLTGGAVTLVDELGFQVVQDGVKTDAGNAMQEADDVSHTVSIRAGRELFGTLTLHKPRAQWRELDEVALQHAATLCALEYVKERAVSETEWRLKGDFVEELLNGRQLRQEELESRCRTLGYPMQGNHLVIAGRASADEQRAPLLHQSAITLMRRLCERQKRSYLLRERSLSVLFVMPDDTASLKILQQFAERWQKLHPDEMLHLGVSNPRALGQLREAAEEALYALQAYPFLARPPSLLRFSEMRGYQFLYPYHRSKESLASLWEPLLSPLIRYDKRHNQQLLETLEAYLAHNGNGLRTSQALYIHRHTLKYRLDQIEEKTGCSLEDAHQRWQLQLALMAFRLQQHLYPASLQ